MTAELIERIEAAEGPDWKLDEEIWLAAIATGEQREKVEVGRDKFGDREASDRVSMMSDGARYTASIDAAMTLVPEGWGFWDVLSRHASDEERSAYAEVAKDAACASHEIEGHFVSATAKAPALALCAAALKAREE